MDQTINYKTEEARGIIDRSSGKRHTPHPNFCATPVPCYCLPRRAKISHFRIPALYSTFARTHREIHMSTQIIFPILAIAGAFSLFLWYHLG